MTDTPPDWVLIEAAKRCEFIPSVEFRRRDYQDFPCFRALCDMILKHEQPPVDRKLLCAEEAACQFWDGNQGAVSWVGRRAIELYEEGFGK